MYFTSAPYFVFLRIVLEQFLRYQMVSSFLYFWSSLRVGADGASPKLIMSRGFHTGDPTIEKTNENLARLESNVYRDRER